MDYRCVMRKLGRRRVLVRAGQILAATTAGLAAQASVPEKGTSSGTKRKLRIVAVAAHPDDAETGCGGTLLRYADQGHSVAVFYLTRGEAGIEGRSEREAAEIRTGEAKKACELLNAHPFFVGQVDGRTELNPTRYDDFAAQLQTERPDILFTHWPVDSQRDHRVASMLVYDAWLKSGRHIPLYFFEVLTGMQSQHFHPTDYVDITGVEPRKRAACFAHQSQDPTNFYPLHEAMHQRRGAEFGTKFAEAFVRHLKSPTAFEGI
jgi:LmbE family N-acetylglucosaminyl deacetylase